MKKSIKKSLKTSNGITLIALVVTIIVLLILAGISISMLSGDNGLLTRTTDAKNKTDEAQIKEEIGLAWNSVQTDGIVNNWDISKKSEELQKDLRMQDSSASTIVSENNIKVSYKGYETTINDKTGAITNFSKQKVKISLTRIGTPVTQAQVLANIPQGFYYVGGTINDGIVISDVENDSMLPADSTGNQFVFVPVEKNQKISLKVTSKDAITSIKLYDPITNEINLNIPENIGNNYDNPNITPTYNGVYKVVVTIGSEIFTETLVVRSLYAKDTFKNEPYEESEYGKYTDEYFLSDEVFQLWNSRVGSPGDKATVYQRLGVADDTAFIAYAKMDSPVGLGEYSDAENYAESVNKNGGFYIGRYEAIKNGDNAQSKKATVDGITSGGASSLSDGMVWNYISQSNALAKAKAFNSNSSLLTGAAWDRTLDWIVETKNKSLDQVAVDSKEWGNYKDDLFTDSINLIKTGAFEQTKSNNIYDLAGSLSEWTTEPYGDKRIFRGGGFNHKGAEYPSDTRFYTGTPSTINVGIGFRIALFL